MSQVSIDPASSSTASIQRAPVRNEQKSDSSDFSALLDSNTSAAAVSTERRDSRPRLNQDERNTSQTGVAGSRNSKPRRSSTDDKTATSTSHAADNSSKSSAPSRKIDQTRDRPDKDRKRNDDDSGSRAVTTNADASNVNGAVAAPVVADTGVQDTTNGVAATAGTTDGTAPAADDASTAQDKPADSSAQPVDPNAAGAASAAALPVAAVPIAVPVLPQDTPAVAAKPVKQPGPAAIGAAAATPSADAATVGTTAQAQIQTLQPNGASPDTDATVAGDSKDAAKPDASAAVKAEFAQSAGSTTEGDSKGSTGPQLIQPDSGFQSLLNLQTPHQIPQPQAASFTVTNAGTTGSAQALSAPVPLHGIAADIAAKAAVGNTSFQIKLDPADLGRIDVRLDVDKHGQVTSHLTVERPATLDLLRNDAPKLQQALENAGLKTGDSGLQFSLRDQSSQQGNDNSGNQGQNSRRLIISENVPVAPVAGGSYGRLRGSNTGVDISI